MKTLSEKKEDIVQCKHPEQVFLPSGNYDGAKEERSREGIPGRRQDYGCEFQGQRICLSKVNFANKFLTQE